MADLEKLAEQTKKMVRAVLLSAPHGLSVADVLKDYKELVMEPLPFHRLGFHNAEDYFQSIKDAVHLRCERGIVIVHGVADETTEHIARMVSNQKSNKRRRPLKRTFYRPQAFSRPQASSGPHASSRPAQAFSRPAQASFRPQTNTSSLPPRFQKMHDTNRTHQNSQFVNNKVDDKRNSNIQRLEDLDIKPPFEIPESNLPNFVKREIAELLKSYPDGIIGCNFNAAFIRRFGKQLNFMKFGFMSLIGLFKSIPDVVIVAQLLSLPTGAYKIYPLMERSKSNSSRELASKRDTTQPSTEYYNSSGKMDIFDDHVINSDNATSKQKREDGLNACSENTQENTHTLLPISVPEKLTKDQDKVSHKARRLSGPKQRILSDEIKSNIRKVLNGRPKGIYSTRFPFEYNHAIGEDLSLMKLGFISVIEMMSTISDVVTIERPNPLGDWLLFVRSSAESKSDPNNNVGNICQEDWKSNIKKVLAAHPMGVPLRDLSQHYKNLTGHCLKPANHGFVSIDSLVVELSGRELSMEYKGEGNVMLLPLCKSSDERQSVPLVTLPSLSTKKEDLGDSIQPIPPDSCGPGVRYTLQQIPEHLKEEEVYIEVYVSNITNPSRFWIQMKGDKTTEALESLMDEMDILYNSIHGEKYCMPPNMLNVGQICAAVFPEDNNWHRCIITKIWNKNLIEVYYVDYGNRCSVTQDMIRILKSRYIKLPCQGIEARLANILPIKRKWTLAARDQLLNLCSNRCLCALITDVKDRVMSICLCDTSGAEDVHINDVLVEENYAIFSPDNMTQAKNDLNSVASSLSEAPAMPDLTGVEEDHTEQKAPGSDTAAPDQSLSQEEDDELETIPRFIKVVQLFPNCDNHLVNYGGTPYLLSSEISVWFWDSDCLKSKLRGKRLVIPKFNVNADDDPDLFEEFHHYEIDTIVSSGEATLYELRSIPRILNAFKHKSVELVEAIKTLYEQFDPDDIYWRGEDDENIHDFDVDDDDDMFAATIELGIEELCLMHTAMQFRRKRLIMEMEQGRGTLSVDELHELEVQMTKLKDRIHAQELASNHQGTVERKYGAGGFVRDLQCINYGTQFVTSEGNCQNSWSCSRELKDSGQNHQTFEQQSMYQSASVLPSPGVIKPPPGVPFPKENALPLQPTPFSQQPGMQVNFGIKPPPGVPVLKQEVKSINRVNPMPQQPNIAGIEQQKDFSFHLLTLQQQQEFMLTMFNNPMMLTQSLAGLNLGAACGLGRGSQLSQYFNANGVDAVLPNVGGLFSNKPS